MRILMGYPLIVQLLIRKVSACLYFGYAWGCLANFDSHTKGAENHFTLSMAQRRAAFRGNT